VIASHQLMIRAGLIRQLTAGTYDFLPLGLRSLKKARRSCARRWTRLAQPKCFCRRSNDRAVAKERPRCEIRRGYVPRQRRRPMERARATHEECVTELMAAREVI